MYCYRVGGKKKKAKIKAMGDTITLKRDTVIPRRHYHLLSKFLQPALVAFFGRVQLSIIEQFPSP